MPKLKPKTIFVKILKASGSDYWYKTENQIGNTFEVHFNPYKHSDKEDYHVFCTNHYIAVEDCVIVDEPMERKLKRIVKEIRKEIK